MIMQTDNARQQAKAQFESVAEMIAALNVDFDRLEELREDAAANAWTAGWNMAGYMPDAEPGTYEDESGARAAIVDELRERAEQCDESAAIVDAASFDTPAAVAAERGKFWGEAADYRAAAEEIEREDLPFIVVNGWHFWITESEQCDLDGEDYQELRELKDAAGECEDREDAEQRIHEDALSVEVRGGWTTPGNEPEPAEYRIVLCTGGPHVEIRGDLDSGTPTTARLYCQDWFTSLDEMPGGEDTLLEYATQFFFGE